MGGHLFFKNELAFGPEKQFDVHTNASVEEVGSWST